MRRSPSTAFQKFHDHPSRMLQLARPLVLDGGLCGPEAPRGLKPAAREQVRVAFLCVMILAIGAPRLVLAQEPLSDAQTKLLAKRAAEADCYRKLAETIYGVRVTSDTFVRDFVAESDDIRSALDTFIKGVKLGPPRYYDDGTCEVVGEVPVETLVRTIKEVHAKHYRGRRVTTVDIERITERLHTDIIRATGQGAPRPDVPADLPAGVEAVIEPLPPGVLSTATVVPPLWRSVGPQARLMAVRAARIDGLRRLLERIKGLRLNSTTLVRDFIAESDEISSRADGIVVGAAEVRTYLNEHELIAEVTLEVPVERVINKIRELHTTHYRGRRVTTTDIVNVRKIIKRDVIVATGSGVPPARFVNQSASPMGTVPPAWFSSPIRETGEAADPDIQSAQGKLRARRAAELDALKKLAEKIKGLQISANTTIRDFIAQYGEVEAQVEALLARALPDEPVYADGRVSVSVTLAGADVWRVIHQHMLTAQRRGE